MQNKCSRKQWHFSIRLHRRTIRPFRTFFAANACWWQDALDTWANCIWKNYSGENLSGRLWLNYKQTFNWHSFQTGRENDLRVDTSKTYRIVCGSSGKNPPWANIYRNTANDAKLAWSHSPVEWHNERSESGYIGCKCLKWFNCIHWNSCSFGGQCEFHCRCVRGNRN